MSWIPWAFLFTGHPFLALFSAGISSPWLTPKEAGDPKKVTVLDHEGCDIWPWNREEDMILAYAAPTDLAYLLARVEAAEAVCRAAEDYTKQREYQNMDAARQDQDRMENVLLLALTTWQATQEKPT